MRLLILVAGLIILGLVLLKLWLDAKKERESCQLCIGTGCSKCSKAKELTFLVLSIVSLIIGIVSFFYGMRESKKFPITTIKRSR